MPPPLFTSLPRIAQLIVAGVAPLGLGFATGAALSHSAALFLSLQGLAVAGGLWAGLEHATVGGGAARGAIGGLFFGAALLAAHHVFAGPDHGLLPGLRPLQFIITTMCGTLLGLAGARLRQRWREPEAAALRLA